MAKNWIKIIFIGVLIFTFFAYIGYQFDNSELKEKLERSTDFTAEDLKAECEEKKDSSGYNLCLQERFNWIKIEGLTAEEAFDICMGLLYETDGFVGGDRCLLKQSLQVDYSTLKGFCDKSYPEKRSCYEEINKFASEYLKPEEIMGGTIKTCKRLDPNGSGCLFYLSNAAGINEYKSYLN